MSSSGELAPYIAEQIREDIVKKLDDMENWLYDEGDYCKKQVHKDKLNELKTLGEPIKKRRMEYERLPVLIEEFSKVLQMKSKIMDAITNKDPKYAHLTKTDIEQLEQALNYYRMYVNNCYGLLNNQQKEKDPSIKVADVEKEFSNFQSTVDPILNKSPPKVPSPPKDTQTDSQNSGQKQNNENQNQDSSQNHHPNQENPNNMEVD